jgi:hypothetical protein
VWICDCPLAGNAGSNPSRGFDVALLRVLSVVCLECDCEVWPTRGCCALRKKCIVNDIYFVVNNCELWRLRWHSGSGAVLQIGRLVIRSQLVSLEFFIDIKSFRSHYGPGVDSASNINEYQEHFLGVKAAGA